MVPATFYTTSGDSAIAKIGWDVSHGYRPRIQGLEDSSSFGVCCLLSIEARVCSMIPHCAKKNTVFFSWPRVGKCFPGIRLRKTWNNERTVLTLTSRAGETAWNT